MTDPTPLVAEILRLRTTLTALRQRYANLLAAARATLGAARDGEPDPLSFLADELTDHDDAGSTDSDSGSAR